MKITLISKKKIETVSFHETVCLEKQLPFHAWYLWWKKSDPKELRKRNQKES